MTTCPTEIKLIEDAMKDTRFTRMLVRYQVILLPLKDRNNTQITDIVGECEHTVGKYVTAYETYGLGGLIPTPPSVQKGSLILNKSSNLLKPFLPKYLIN